MLTAMAALKRLKEGNRRFVAGANELSQAAGETRRKELVSAQTPFAAVISCSDSRVSPEIVFDQGLGNLFVIRVAGNVIGPSQMESAEFAVQELGVPLVVVLGHTMCAAVLATLQELMQPQQERPTRYRSLIETIKPAVQPLLQAKLMQEPEALIDQAVRAHVCAAAESLRQGPSALRQRVAARDVLVVESEYSLASGAVDFFGADGEPRE